MATGTLPPTVLPPPPPVAADSLEYERIIQRQLRRTSRHVRLVDLACGLAVWAIGVLLLFIVAALADHLIGLGIAGRFVGLLVLLGGTGYYLASRIVPLLLRAINPTYAARTIEDATPALKNSLINFLLLRQDRAGIREIVYQAVEQKAATDIAAVPVETTVDRTPLIHTGYVLCGIMAVFAAYKIFSPKDPFQTVARVLAPWADIARPSRVQITDVQPGNDEVYHGQTITISANIQGLRERDRIKLLYTSADGQTVDRPVEMKLAATGRYEAALPPPDMDAFSASSGIQQDLTYRILAGDAETSSFRLRVISAPTIIVERLQYEFPPYTKKPPETVPNQGDIRALEGTKVTIHAVANQPIKMARLEFDPTSDGGASELVQLPATETRLSGTITLLLKSDRQTPWHKSYQVRFYNQRDQKSEQPILHKIDVIPDLPPEVQIVQPKQRVEVPENGEQLIEVRALDPDFGLSRLRIEGAPKGKPPVSLDLLPYYINQPPQATVTHTFFPRDHNLVAGDEFNYVAVAEDNRTGPNSSDPQPNVTKTAQYTFVITTPIKNDPAAGNPSTQPPSASDKSQPKDSQSKKSRDGAPPKTQQSRGKSDDAAPKNPNQKPSPPMDEGAKSKQDQQTQPPGDQQKQQQGKSDSSQTGKSPPDQRSDTQQQGGQSGQSGADQQSKSQDQSKQGGQSSSGGKGESNQQSGAKSDGKSGSSAAQDKQGSQSSGDRSQPSGQQSGDPQQGSGQPNNSGSGQGKAHDGEAIERIFKELQPQGQQSSDDAKSAQQPSQQSEQQRGQEQNGQKQFPADAAQNESGKSQQSGAAGQSTPGGQKPGGENQKQAPQTQAKQSDAPTESAKDQLPDEQKGQGSAEQKSGGNKGGAPQGENQSKSGEKATPSQGEKRDPGAGKTGEEGAGTASKDKSGSGEAIGENRDRPKELGPDSSKPEEGEPSPASQSKKQSDSKGGQSGDESGGGKQGAGQTGAQEGNDSAGSKSAADQGAGKANETGAGETGSKAGGQQQAAGKTGQSGDQKGQGSGARPDEQGAAPAPAGDSPKSKASEGRDPSEAGKSQGGKSGGSGPVIDGGGDGNRPPPDGSTPSEVEAADAANLEYSRKATEMVLRRLKEEEHNPDPDLLEKLGWTREDLAAFLRRWEALQKSAEAAPDGKRELDEALRSLGLRDPTHRKRAGGAATDNQRDLRDSGNRSSPPTKYRDLFDAFRKGAARSRE